MSSHSASPSTSDRAQRSCVTCRLRKVRCNKQSPCSQCARGGHSCLYPKPRVAGWMRSVAKSTTTQFEKRVTELEKSLIATPQRHEAQLQLQDNIRPSAGSASASFAPNPPIIGSKSAQNYTTQREEVLLKNGTSSQYLNETLISHVIKNERQVQSALSTPKSVPEQNFTVSPFDAMGILSIKCSDKPLTDYLPCKTISLKLWGVYVESIDPCSKVLHIPTDEITIYKTISQPQEASNEDLALCFSIYYAATVAMISMEMDQLREQAYESLHRYKHGIEQAFASGQFLNNPTVPFLQALSIYMVALRVNNTSRGIWILNGLAIRSAQSIGLHRDGRILNLSPFESEVRRRLWWRLLSLDGRAAEDHGLQDISDNNPPGIAVELPLNIEDTDLYPDMRDLPVPRLGYTRMTLLLVNIEIARALGQMLPTMSPIGSFRAKAITKARDKMAHIMEHCSQFIPQQRLAYCILGFIIRKLDFIARQQDIINFSNTKETPETEQSFIEAIQILDEASKLWDDEILRPFRWGVHAYRQFQTVLYILWYICIHPNNAHCQRALQSVESHLNNTWSYNEPLPHETKWMTILAMKEKATTALATLKEGNSSQLQYQSFTQNETNEGLRKSNRNYDGEQDHNTLAVSMDWTALLEDFYFDPNLPSLI